MTEYDILTDEGHRLVTCIRDGQNIFIEGKGGGLRINSFLEQVFNPGTIRRKLEKKAG